MPGISFYECLISFIVRLRCLLLICAFALIQHLMIEPVIYEIKQNFHVPPSIFCWLPNSLSAFIKNRSLQKINHLKVDFLQVYQVALVKHRIRKSPEDYIIGCDIYDDQDTYRFTFNWKPCLTLLKKGFLHGFVF